MEQNNSNLLLNPCAKKRREIKREYPFPIVSRSCQAGTDKNWKCFEGHLQNDYVLVHDERAIKDLYTMGYYGTGTLSKNAPMICTTRRVIPVKEKRREAPQGPSRDEDIINVLDSDDENPKMKKEKEADDVEVLLSVSSSSDEDSNLSRNPSEKESLQLTLEEAYFLSYGLGCLVVFDKNQPMNLARLWNKFCELTPNERFPVNYTAYHHFRSKGWIVKHGVKYGADYVLYKDGPPFYHATYSVIVKAVKEQNLREARGNMQFTWSSLHAMNRMNKNNGKGLMFLFVIKPNAVSENKISTPFCVSQFKLEEVLFKRWVPSENREESD